MEFLLVLLLLAGAAYSFFKSNTRRGAETVRAYVFLSGLRTGASVEEANFLASFDVANGPTHVIRDAIEHVRYAYGGKQRPMIAEAYRSGMHPKLSYIYRLLHELLPTDGAS